MNENMSILSSTRIEKLTAALLIAGTVFVAFLAIAELRGLFQAPTMVGSTISIDGQGKVTAIPDVSTINFTVSGEGKTASIAKDEATKKNNVALELLKNMGIEEKNIKTTSYQVQPKYAYPQPCYSGVCTYEEQRVVGYTVTQSTEVKIKDPKIDVGDVLSSLGDAGISQLYGPNFTVEDINAKREEARALAIADAKAKADKLARDLGVRVVRVVSFNEGGYGYPMPMYSRADAAMGGMMAEKAVAPVVAPGESEIQVNVNITFEIR